MMKMRMPHQRTFFSALHSICIAENGKDIFQQIIHHNLSAKMDTFFGRIILIITGKGRVRMFDPRKQLGIDVAATGRRIDTLLRINHLTTRQVSDAFQVSYQCVDKWRKGKCLPELQNLYVLSRMLGVRIDELLVGVTATYEPYEECVLGHELMIYAYLEGLNPCLLFCRDYSIGWGKHACIVETVDI